MYQGDEVERPENPDSPIEHLLNVKDAPASGRLLDPNRERLTLSEVKQLAKQEAQEAKQQEIQNRFETLNFTSEDRNPLDDVDLRVYYCSICASLGLVVEKGLESLPSYEGCYVLDIEKNFHRIYIDKSDTVFIKREEGVEARVMFRCRHCDFPVAYRIKDVGDEMTGFVDKQHEIIGIEAPQ